MARHDRGQGCRQAELLPEQPALLLLPHGQPLHHQLASKLTLAQLGQQEVFALIIRRCIVVSIAWFFSKVTFVPYTFQPGASTWFLLSYQHLPASTICFLREDLQW